MPSLLRHLHLTAPISFARASTLQAILTEHFLAHKHHPHSLPPPIPTLLSFTTYPIYTLGRREKSDLALDQEARLLQPLQDSNTLSELHPNITHTLRGGLTTFHGPGQLLFYPSFDLKGIQSARWPRGLTARCYVHLLEETTIRTLRGFGVSTATRTSDPGVWVSDEEKIAALGVHLRRNIPSSGVAVNVTTDLRWFDRIVACGLEGKRMTTLRDVLGREMGEGDLKDQRIQEIPEVARVWADELARGLWGEEARVEGVEVEDQRAEELLREQMER